MKKLLAALLLTATTAGVASANMTGFYVGVGAVTGSTTAQYRQNPNSFPSGAINVGGNVRTEAGKTIFGGRLTAGYGMTFAGCGWFGAEVYATVLNTKVTMFDSLGGNSALTRIGKGVLKNRYNYGLELKIGYHFTKDTVGFVGLAAEAGKYKLEWTQGSFDGVNQNDLTNRPTLSSSKTKVYIKPVIGVRTTGIGGNRNLFLEMKYGYGFTNRVRLNVASDGATRLGAASGSATNGVVVSARPRTHELSLTIGWRF